MTGYLVVGIYCPVDVNICQGIQKMVKFVKSTRKPHTLKFCAGLIDVCGAAENSPSDYAPDLMVGNLNPFRETLYIYAGVLMSHL